MISKFSLSGKRRKGFCGVFCGRSISEFNNSCDSDQRDFIASVKTFYRGFISELLKEQRGEETILNLKCFLFKCKTLFKILYWNILKLASIVTQRGVRYIHFHSISLFEKLFWNIYNSLSLHLLKE